MNYFNEDTIAAIASAPEVAAAVGIIRISGPRAWPTAAAVLFKPKAGTPFEAAAVESHRLYRALVRRADGQNLDDAMFVWMKGPHSFTGEDVVELHLHGNPYLLRRVLQAVCAAGAREAMPGEFSFRAFRNGKLSLAQAESINDLISSKSEESSRRSLSQLLGHGVAELALLKRELVDRLAEIEVDIDFSDQGLSILDYDAFDAKLGRWQERVAALRQEFLDSRPIAEGVRLALVGAPNSGKSSLFNRMLGEDRSIVSQQAGTTRDVVRESIYLKDVLFRLSDTAGIRATADSIEAEGIDRSFGEVRTAQAVIWVLDALAEGEGSIGSLESRWAELKSHLDPSARVIIACNKADLVKTTPRNIEDFAKSAGLPLNLVSASTGEAIRGLIADLVALFAISHTESGNFVLSRWRHYEVLGSAYEAVAAARAKVKSGERFPDLLSIDLRTALSKVGEISGEFSSEDLLHHIFAEFCIGK
ncbi:MAG: tRNA uridine-5-carboxymethylaminomethyl(34) synthesis GTPase MnmE [Proteobacteria bacterium]|nr:MAG: tRNA uridine-5-carboxymethylaminomethyl(34) synthesis GTPase MnmE [Pseudomonadota bacterium]